MSVCTARLLLNLRKASVKQGKGRAGDALWESQHWAFGELGPDSVRGGDGSYPVGMDSSGVGVGWHGKRVDNTFPSGGDEDKETVIQQHVLPYTNVDDVWRGPPSSTQDEESRAIWLGPGPPSHPYASSTSLDWECMDNVIQDDVDARSLALLQREAYPSADSPRTSRSHTRCSRTQLSVSAVSNSEVSAVTPTSPGSGSHRNGKGNLLSAVGSIPSSFRAAVLAAGRFSSGGLSPSEPKLASPIEMGDILPRVI